MGSKASNQFYHTIVKELKLVDYLESNLWFSLKLA